VKGSAQGGEHGLPSCKCPKWLWLWWLWWLWWVGVAGEVEGAEGVEGAKGVRSFSGCHPLQK
jgi:hypothetical protein